MTILIFSSDLTEISPLELETQRTLQQLFPKHQVAFSSSMDTLDSQSDSPFTLVLPGGSLAFTLDYFKQNPQTKDNVLSGLDNGGHYIGFCAGAYFATEHWVSSKGLPDQFEYQDYSDKYNIIGHPLNVVSDAAALGYFKPYREAMLRSASRNYEPTNRHYHAVEIKTETKTFHSLYYEGCTFLNNDRKTPYSSSKDIVARYQLDYSLEAPISPPRERALAPYTVSLGPTPPAALHVTKKNSHRYLLGFHPELSVNASTFIPAFEKSCAEKPNGLLQLQPLSTTDKEKITKAEKDNMAFLEGMFSAIRLK